MTAIADHSLLSIVPAGRKKRVRDASGNLHVPDAYRTNYQSLGSWAVGADQGPGAKELHVVYASPGTIAAYRRNGSFPDGAVLVKEVFETATGKVTTGTVSRAETLKDWLVMVRDTKGELPPLSRAGTRNQLDYVGAYPSLRQ